ncbi:glycerophosphodiester phosphodiesterase [Pareuzebyella sediminis]|uniref:glycerophosphodiester phosphodiesterase n=1 Tax=Pareuzebyella sediminis TaxID=2607998 RepID=UPI002939051A|nr:glycerophosphodiester phosphodiesterase [Pareuzebyella sediminis]
MMKRNTIFILLSLAILSGCMQSGPLTIGHRGAMGHETENTLASIQKAIDLGVDMIEIDVFKIKSGEIIVFHDNTVDRLTNGMGEIEGYTLLELKKLRLEGGHSIPTLEEVLDLMDAKVDLNIELKGADTAADVDAIVHSYIDKGKWKLSDFIISSFKWGELESMRKIDAQIPIAILIDKDPLKAIAIAEELQAEAINPNFESLNPQNTLAIKEAGFKIYPWTVNETEDITKMKSLGVDGIITNYPERIR